MSFLRTLQSQGGQPAAPCPSCTSMLVEKTPFRTASEVMCRCYRCFRVFRVRIASETDTAS